MDLGILAVTSLGSTEACAKFGLHSGTMMAALLWVFLLRYKHYHCYLYLWVDLLEVQLERERVRTERE